MRKYFEIKFWHSFGFMLKRNSHSPSLNILTVKGSMKSQSKNSKSLLQYFQQFKR